MKVILERKGFQYLGLRNDGVHCFEDSFGNVLLCKAAKFVTTTGHVKFCNFGKPIEDRKTTNTIRK